MTSNQQVEVHPNAEDNGFAHMMATLVAQNLIDHPERRRLFAETIGRVAMVVTDAEVAITLDFLGGKLIVRNGIYGIPSILMRGSAEIIGDLSRMESLGSLLGNLKFQSPLMNKLRRVLDQIPDPRGPVNRAIASATRSGDLTVSGLPRNLPLLLKTSELLAIH